MTNANENKKERNSCWCVAFYTPICAFLLVLLGFAVSATGESGAPTVITPFRCSEVEQVLQDEDLTIQQPDCQLHEDSFSNVNYSLSKVGNAEFKFSNEVSQDDRLAIMECVASNRTAETHGWLLNFKIQDFLKSKCSGLSEVNHMCAEHVQKPYQVTETYQIAINERYCPMRISIIHDHRMADCDLLSSHSLCTKERSTRENNGERSMELPNCVKNGKYDVNMEVLYRHFRKSAVYNGPAFTVENREVRLKNHSVFCDSLTIETARLVPELADGDFLVLVLLSFKVYDQKNNWTHTTRIHAVRLVRDVEEQHVQSCNATDHTDPLIFHYQNVTNFAKQAGFFQGFAPGKLGKNDTKQINRVSEFEHYISVDSISNTVTLGAGLSNLKSICTVLLDHLQTKLGHPNKLEELALVLRFTVSTALDSYVTRNWTVSVVFAFVMPYGLESEERDRAVTHIDNVPFVNNNKWNTLKRRRSADDDANGGQLMLVRCEVACKEKQTSTKSVQLTDLQYSDGKSLEKGQSSEGVVNEAKDDDSPRDPLVPTVLSISIISLFLLLFVLFLVKYAFVAFRWIRKGRVTAAGANEQCEKTWRASVMPEAANEREAAQSFMRNFRQNWKTPEYETYPSRKFETENECAFEGHSRQNTLPPSSALEHSEQLRACFSGNRVKTDLPKPLDESDVCDRHSVMNSHASNNSKAKVTVAQPKIPEPPGEDSGYYTLDFSDKLFENSHSRKLSSSIRATSSYVFFHSPEEDKCDAM